MSKGAERVNWIQGEMYRKCVAVVNFTVMEPSSFPPTVSGTSGAEEEARDETKGDGSQRPGIVSWCVEWWQRWGS
ncbi:unnamed protein product [Eretmochelys imbricata]